MFRCLVGLVWVSVFPVLTHRCDRFVSSFFASRVVVVFFTSIRKLLFMGCFHWRRWGLHWRQLKRRVMEERNHSTRVASASLAFTHTDLEVCQPCQTAAVAD